MARILPASQVWWTDIAFQLYAPAACGADVILLIVSTQEIPRESDSQYYSFSTTTFITSQSIRDWIRWESNPRQLMDYRELYKFSQ